MSIQYFYNFCIADRDDTDLNSDILSAVRRSYFATFEKIRDKITYDSEGQSILYEYTLEKDKPLSWNVKTLNGDLLQEVTQGDGGRYYLCFYKDEKLYKRLLFSKLHTLLKAEYTDENGAVCSSIEPRKVQGGLCLLYHDARLSEPVVLSAMPDVFDERIVQRLNAEYTDYAAVASTNDGIIWFMSDEQISRFRAFVDGVQAELDSMQEESFVGEEKPLYDKINPKDFNIKRNLSTVLDISDAKAFGEENADDTAAAVSEDAAAAEKQITEEPVAEESVAEEPITEEPVEEQLISEESTSEEPITEEPVAEQPISEEQITEEPAEEEQAEETEAVIETEKTEVLPDPEPQSEPETPSEPAAASEPQPENTVQKADKLIMADGAVYSYFGALDPEGNRTGYGRTVTDLGITAYEGMYRSDKRSGKGAYYYKDGTLCYSGDWSENVRHGVGVGISAKDGSMHVGRWANNKPHGNGARVSADGQIKFVCKELSDGGTVLMNYSDHDKVIMTKYDKNGNKLSEKVISLTDI